jgi:hypothetical protein
MPPDAVAPPPLDTADCGRSLVYSPPSDPIVEHRMRAQHQCAAQALTVTVEPGGEFWGWAGRTLGAPARTAAGALAWLRLVSAPVDKASGKLWDGAREAQRAFGDLDGRRPALLSMWETIDDGTAYRAELSARVDQPVLSDDAILHRDLGLSGSWWSDLTEALEKVVVLRTDRVAVRQQYMDRAIPQFVGIEPPAAPCWTTAHGDLHWANLTAPPLRILDWESWGRAPEGFDGAMLYAYSLLQPDVAVRVRETFPVLGSAAGLAAEATVCAMLLQTVGRGDNLVLEIRSGNGLRTCAAAVRPRESDRVEPRQAQPGVDSALPAQVEEGEADGRSDQRGRRPGTVGLSVPVLERCRVLQPRGQQRRHRRMSG